MAHLYLSDFATDIKVRRVYAGSLVITLHHLMDMLIFRYWFLHFSSGQMLPIGNVQNCERVLVDILKVGLTCLLCIVRSFMTFYILRFFKNTLGL